MSDGWISLHRKLRENKYWLEPRKFSKAEAWIDILLTAGHKEVKIAFGNTTIKLKRGQFLTSQLKLAERWSRDRGTVKNFLELFKKDGQIDFVTSNKYLIITVVNWDVYQNLDRERSATESSSNHHQSSTKPTTINNYNNVNNENKVLKAIILLKTDFLQVYDKYKGNKELIKNHLLKERYSEFQIEKAFRDYKRSDIHRTKL